MEIQSRIVQVALSDGTIVYVEASPIGEQQVVFETLPFKKISSAIEAISKEIVETINKISPDKASVKLGLDVALETTGLTLLIAKGSSKANLEITLEWSQATKA